jgi:hypothetical protein
MVQPDGVADNFRGKTVTLIAEPLSVHAAQSAKWELNRQYRFENSGFHHLQAGIKLMPALDTTNTV